MDKSISDMSFLEICSVVIGDHSTVDSHGQPAVTGHDGRGGGAFGHPAPGRSASGHPAPGRSASGHPVPGRSVACETCSADFADDAQLWAHVRHEHARDRRLACPMKGCGKRFLRRAHRAGHLVHHGRGAAGDVAHGAVAAEPVVNAGTAAVSYVVRPDTCELCGRLYGSRRLLDKHVARTHPAARGMACGVCTLMVRDELTMVRHVRRAHAAEMTSAHAHLRCAVCAKPYGNIALMRRHGRVHSVTAAEYVARLQGPDGAV